MKFRKFLKRLFFMLIALILIFCIGTFFVLRMDVFGGVPEGKRLERMQKSPNYKDGKFQNLSSTPQFAEGYSMSKVMYDFIFGKKDSLLTPTSPIKAIKTDLKKLDKNDDLFIWFGHSSYYIQTNGVNFLIDPVFSEYGSPFPIFNKAFSGTTIYSPEDMPEIDYLVITHDHFDHLDYATVKALKSKVKKVILPLGVGAHLEKWGYSENQLIEEDWNTHTDLLNNIKITFTPARHFSGRKFSRDNTLWTSYVLQTPTRNLFLGGDSGYDKHFKEIGEKYGPFDVAFVEDGQYNEAWKYIHALPEEVVQAGVDLNVKHLMPVHFGKFALAKHSWKEPIQKVTALAKEKNLNVITPQIGEVVYFDKDTNFKDWWD